MLTWETYFEKSGYLDSPSYAETIEYFRKFVKETPWCRMGTFGVTAQGRELQYLVVSKDNGFTPKRARRNQKAIILIQNGIHPGEIEGKDATMLLLREMLISREKEYLLDNLTLVIIPVLNADGHERCTEFNRSNQNGPTKMGWRVTAQNLNLNRDFMKADSPEMRGLLKLYASWRPDFIIDNHTTNGADYQYHITYGMEKKQLLEKSLAKWAEEKILPAIEAGTTQAGFLVGPYVETKGEKLEDGLIEEVNLPRYSTGYAAAQNRLGLLVETHSLKDFKNRVFSTKAMNEAALSFINTHAQELRKLNKQADERVIKKYAINKKLLPIAFDLNMKKFSTFIFKGKKCTWEISEVTGGEVARYTDEPYDFEIPFYNTTRSSAKIIVPRLYVIPKEFANVARILKLHGVKVRQLKKEQVMEIEHYRLLSPEFASKPYEGRTLVSCGVEPFKVAEELPVGTFIVETAQRTLKIIVHLLEPQSADSFLQWGFFNAFFERKEYAEAYVFEPIAKQMLLKNEALREAFEAKILADTEFAADPDARLDYLYQRSEYFDKRENIYVIGRVF